MTNTLASTSAAAFVVALGLSFSAIAGSPNAPQGGANEAGPSAGSAQGAGPAMQQTVPTQKEGATDFPGSSQEHGAMPGRNETLKSDQTGVIDRDQEKKGAAVDRQGNDNDRSQATDKDKTANGDSKHAKFEAGDKQKVRSYFGHHKPNVTRVDRDRVNVSIGVGIPTGIELYPLPSGIVVAAGDCPLDYFLWGDDVVIVDSCSREVVDIVPNIG